MILLFKDCPDLEEFLKSRIGNVEEYAGLLVENNSACRIKNVDEKVGKERMWNLDGTPWWRLDGLKDFLKERYPETLI